MKKQLNIFNLSRRAVILILITTILASAVPDLSVAAASTISCKGKYPVKVSDTLNKIAEKYSVRAEDLASANGIYSPYYTIYVGQYLCIPVKSKIITKIPKWGDNPAADFKVKLTQDSFSITTSNFPKNSVYFVKVAGSNPGNNKNYTKIGRLPTGKGGTLTASFPLPDKLVNTNAAWVCLKNVMTDANVCRMDLR